MSRALTKSFPEAEAELEASLETFARELYMLYLRL